MGRTQPKTKDRRSKRYLRAFWVMGSVLAAYSIASAVLTDAATSQEPESSDRRWDSEACLSCHDGATSTATFPSGEELEIGVDGDAYRSSPHVSIGVQCVHCHPGIVRTPHDELTVPDAQTFSESLATSCSVCHWREYTVALDAEHALLEAEQRPDAPECVDCHDPHASQASPLDRPEMQGTCSECHTEQVWEGIEAIHVLNPIQVQEASPPPLVLFYALIALAVIALVGLTWAGVAAIQWGRRRIS
jgi:predicted CXXCH cytochrome family protein